MVEKRPPRPKFQAVEAGNQNTQEQQKQREWVSVKAFAEEHSIPLSTFRRKIEAAQRLYREEEILKKEPDPEARGQVVSYLRRDVAEQIIREWEKKNSELQEVPSGWKTVRQIEAESDQSLRDLFDAVLKNGEKDVDYLFGKNSKGVTTAYFSPECAARVLTAKESGERLYQKPERENSEWLTIPEIMNQYTISDHFMREIIAILRKEEPDAVVERSDFPDQKQRRYLQIHRSKIPRIQEIQESFERDQNRIKELRAQGYISAGEVQAKLSITSFDEYARTYQERTGDTNGIIVVSDPFSGREHTLCSPQFVQALEKDVQERVPSGYYTLDAIAEKQGGQSIDSGVIEAIIKRLEQRGETDIFIDRFDRSGQERSSTRETRYYSQAFMDEYPRYKAERERPEGFYTMSDLEKRYPLSKKVISNIVKKLISKNPSYRTSVSREKMIYHFYSQECIDALDRLLPPASWLSIDNALERLDVDFDTFTALTHSDQGNSAHIWTHGKGRITRYYNPDYIASIERILEQQKERERKGSER